jgi:hypothetical protein
MFYLRRIANRASCLDDRYLYTFIFFFLSFEFFLWGIYGACIGRIWVFILSFCFGRLLLVGCFLLSDSFFPHIFFFFFFGDPMAFSAWFGDEVCMMAGLFVHFS